MYCFFPLWIPSSRIRIDISKNFDARIPERWCIKIGKSRTQKKDDLSSKGRMMGKQEKDGAKGFNKEKKQ